MAKVIIKIKENDAKGPHCYDYTNEITLDDFKIMGLCLEGV